jgi:hypothetical protein
MKTKLDTKINKMTCSFFGKENKKKRGKIKNISLEPNHFSVGRMPNIVGKNTMSHFQRRFGKAVCGHETTPHTRCKC